MSFISCVLFQLIFAKVGQYLAYTGGSLITQKLQTKSQFLVYVHAGGGFCVFVTVPLTQILHFFAQGLQLGRSQ